MNATVAGNAQRVVVEMVSGNAYAVLGVKPQLGRAIEPADDAVPGAGSAAVISDGLWEREFARDPKVLGQTIKLNQAVLTIVGVNPPEFTGAKNVQQSPDVFVPISLQPVIDPQRRKVPPLADPNFWWVNVMARTKPGVTDCRGAGRIGCAIGGSDAPCHDDQGGRHHARALNWPMVRAGCTLPTGCSRSRCMY